MLHTNSVAEETIALIQRLMSDKELHDFNLVGGTALSLLIGHRISVDIDLFSNKPFDSVQLADHLINTFGAENVRTLRNGLFCFIDKVKVDILSHQYEWIAPVKTIDGMRLISIEDIAAMKVNAIVDSGIRLKDFVDMYYLLEQKPLKEIMELYELKYPGNSGHIGMRAVTYHEHIDFATGVELMYDKLNWTTMAHRLKAAALNPNKIFPSTLPTLKQSKKSRGRGL